NNAITIPTNDIAKAAQVKATATSVSANASIIVFPAAPPPVYQRPHIPTDTSVTSGKTKNHTLPPSPLKDFPNSTSTEYKGVAPSSINWPVVSARYSAFAIGTKSRFIKIKVGTATRLKIA